MVKLSMSFYAKKEIVEQKAVEHVFDASTVTAEQAIEQLSRKFGDFDNAVNECAIHDNTLFVLSYGKNTQSLTSKLGQGNRLISKKMQELGPIKGHCWYIGKQRMEYRRFPLLIVSSFTLIGLFILVSLLFEFRHAGYRSSVADAERRMQQLQSDSGLSLTKDASMVSGLRLLLDLVGKSAVVRKFVCFRQNSHLHIHAIFFIKKGQYSVFRTRLKKGMRIEHEMSTLNKDGQRSVTFRGVLL